MLADFEAHILRFVCEVETPMRLPTHKGSALRGAWAEALMSRACPQPWVCRGGGCAMPHGCPIAALVGPANEGSSRGKDVPRPYVIEPPVDSRTEYAPGDTLEWRMVLFGKAVDWFPYVVMAVQLMGERGMGMSVMNWRSQEGAGGQGRGKFHLREMWASNPLTGVQQRLFSWGERTVQTPGLPITYEQVRLMSSQLSTDRITLHFKTPLRLTQDYRETGGERNLTHDLPPFHTLVQRLDGRLHDLTTYYATFQIAKATHNFNSAGAEEWPRLDNEKARQVAAEGEVVWLDLERYSSRQERRLPMGGLRGRVTYRGELGPFLPLIVWGRFTHVGKYAVMGNGGYEIEA